jgi:hypothetical protein
MNLNKLHSVRRPVQGRADPLMPSTQMIGVDSAARDWRGLQIAWLALERKDTVSIHCSAGTAAL